MGSFFSRSMDQNLKKQQEFMLLNSQLQLERQILMQNQMREKQMAMQIAWSREFLKYYGTFFSLAALGLTSGAIRGKKPALFIPVVPLGFVFAYQYDMGYGTLIRRMKDNLQDSTNREINQLMIQTLLGTNLEQLQKPDFHLQQQQQLLKDPFIAYDDFKDRIPASEGFSEYMHQVEDTDRKIQRESQSSGTRGSNLFPWTAFSRTRREMSIGVAGICCKWGCTKSEISTLC